MFFFVEFLSTVSIKLHYTNSFKINLAKLNFRNNFKSFITISIVCFGLFSLVKKKCYTGDNMM